MRRYIFDEKSGHCLNYFTYPVKYKTFLYEFFVDVGLTDDATIARADMLVQQQAPP